MRHRSKNRISWKSVRDILLSEKQSNNDLLKLIGDLYELNNENKVFLQTRFSLIDPLKPYKTIIKRFLYPDPNYNEDLSLSKARKAISDYKKAVGDFKGVVELMVYYVECGNQFTVDFGDIDEPFYDSLESMFAKVVKELKKSDGTLIEEYFPRLLKVVKKADCCGWGYPDAIGSELQEAFPQKF